MTKKEKYDALISKDVSAALERAKERKRNRKLPSFEYKKMNLTKQILNDALNKALITDRIKGVPSSNKIADFVNKYVESKQLTKQEIWEIQHILKKEREVMFEFANDYADQVMGGMLKRAEQYYKETFNTKER